MLEMPSETFLLFLFYIRAGGFSFQGQIRDESQSKFVDVQLAGDISGICSLKTLNPE